MCASKTVQAFPSGIKEGRASRKPANDCEAKLLACMHTSALTCASFTNDNRTAQKEAKQGAPRAAARARLQRDAPRLYHRDGSATTAKPDFIRDAF